MAEQPEFKAGIIALAGRPNVGKSTLLNALVGQKVSIVTSKPQTTRHRIMGIRHEPGCQFVFVDTPGIHLGGKKALNRSLNRAAESALSDVDWIVFVVEALKITDEDRTVLEKLASHDNVILAINKVDKIKDKDALLPFIAQLSEKMAFAAIVPLSALKGSNTEALLAELRPRLEESPPLFPAEQSSDRGEQFMVAEIVREKLMERLRDELPYSLTVTVDQYENDGSILKIASTIWVERDGQKKIVIGQKGAAIRAIGAAARSELEQRLDTRIFLELWVKVKDSWADDERSLRQFGIDEQ
ncbi:MAG: GTPase Era [Gammaproteobacteria bacterium]|nr:GTPase Era [Gammaproteobacteria bacterium]